MRVFKLSLSLTPSHFGPKDSKGSLLVIDDVNADVEVERLVAGDGIVVEEAVVGDAADLQFEVRRLLEAAPEVQAPHTALVDDLETIRFVALNDLVLHVILSGKQE